tara:strand:- start:24310 stop:24747 length:438 start_codon:yes stop_codon:yes gene_type:complete
VSIFKIIKDDQLQARKNLAKGNRPEDKLRVKLLTTIIGEADPFGRNEVTDEQITQKLKKFLKNIEDSIKSYEQRKIDTSDLFLESKWIMDYLPKPMSEDEMISFLENNEFKKIGQAMGMVNKYSKDHDLMVDKAKFAELAMKYIK